MRKRQSIKNILSFVLAFAMILGAVPLPDAVLPVKAESSDPVVTISSAEEWDSFAASVSNGTTYSGKTVKLTRDISVTTMAGSDQYKSFRGTFDGGGHTLSFTCTSAPEYCAPFRYICGATIKSLRVTGTITTEHKIAAGIVAYCTNSGYSDDNIIRDCISSITINSSVSGDGTHGGFVGELRGYETYIKDCLFDGKLLGESTDSCGGFAGYNSLARLYIDNCLYEPSEVSVGTLNSKTFSRFDPSYSQVFLSKCYYTDSTFGTDQGTAVGEESGTDTPEKLAAALGDRWGVINGKAVPIMISKDLAYATISGIESSYVTEGEELDLDYEVIAEDGTVLTKDTDFSTVLKNDDTVVDTVQKEGDYTLTVTALDGNSGGYFGSKTINFTVVVKTRNIRSEADWNRFVSAVNEGDTYKDETVTLLNDISVSTMAGTGKNVSFQGTFDGNRHTLTVDYHVKTDACAPFRYINGAIIKNLRVAGLIETSKQFAAGIAAYSYGISSINNCISSVTINSSVSGDGSHGGLVGRVEGNSLSISDCLFDGKLLGSSTDKCGGFVGYANKTLSVGSGLFAPSEVTMGTDNSCTIARKGSVTCYISNCYYTESFGTEEGTLVGDDSNTETPAKLAAALGEEWVVSGEKVVPFPNDGDLSLATISNVEKVYISSGSEVHPSPVVTSPGGAVLTEGRDYTVSYSPDDDSAPGYYRLTVAAAEGGNCSGSKTVGYTVCSESDKPVSGLGTGAITNPVYGAGGWSYVYYGKFDVENSTKYRVLDRAATEFNDNKTLLLDCNGGIDYKVKFDDDGVANEGAERVNQWQYSDLRKGLNGDLFLTKEGNLTETEKASIAFSTKTSKSSNDGSSHQYLIFAPLNRDKVFVLDAAEATRLSYGYPSTVEANEYRSKQNGSESPAWWLRSPFYHKNDTYNYDYDNNTKVGYVGSAGSLSYWRASDRVMDVMPAFNVDLPSVIFSSMIPGEPGAYKLTLRDEKLKIAMPENMHPVVDGTTATVYYAISGDHADNTDRVSVLLLKTGYEAGKCVTNDSTEGIPEYTYLSLDTELKTDGSRGVGTFTLPDAYAGLTWGLDYRVYILAEDIHGARETDNASAPVELQMEHFHHFAYSALENVLTATCTAPGCDLPGGKVALTIAALSAEAVYDGNEKGAAISGDTGLLGTPDITYQKKTGNGVWGSETATAPINAGTYMASISLGTGDGKATAFTVYDIDPKPVSITGISASGKDYDGTTDAAVTGKGAVSGRIGDDDVSVSDGTASFADADAGEDKTVSFAGFSLIGEDSGNYILSGQPVDVQAEIRKRSITIKADDQTVGKDGSIETGTGKVKLSSGTLVEGHSISAVTLTPSSTAVATSSGTITPGDAVIKDSSETDVTSNYDISYLPGNLTVTAEQVYISGGISAENKTYDGGTAADISGTAVIKRVKDDAVIPGLTVSSISAGFEDKKVGINKPVSVTAVTLSNADDYTLDLEKTNETLGLSANILQKEVTVTGLSVSGKEYDGTTDAAVTDTGEVSGRVGNDDVSVSAGTASFADADAGEDKTVSFTGFSLIGEDSGNYILSGQSAYVQADIRKRSITIRAYDQIVEKGGSIETGTGKVRVSSGTLVEGHSISAVTLTSSSTAVTTAGGTITPGDAVITDPYEKNVTSNYDISYAPGTLTVTAEQVYISGITADDKSYDGNTDAVISGRPVLKTVRNGEVVSGVTVFLISASFDTKNAHSNIPVRLTGGKLYGISETSEYYLNLDKTNEILGLSANILQREVELSWSDTNLVYNGMEQKPKAAVANLVSGDTCEVTVTGGETYANYDGQTYTAEATALSDSNYKLPGSGSDRSVAFTIGKAEIKGSDFTAPEPVNNLIYNGRDQVLVTGGSVAGGIGTMYYALTDITTIKAPPFDGRSSSEDRKWKTDPPSARLKGHYRVWYMAAGDRNHADTATDHCDVEIYSSDLYIVSYLSFYAYTGDEIMPEYEVWASRERLFDNDYTVSLTKDGEAADVVKEKGNYVLTVTATEESGYEGEDYFTFIVEDPPMTIGSEKDWNVFAEAVRSGFDYDGMTVLLTRDITVSKSVGDVEMPDTSFAGTFDGCGHTLTFNCTATRSDSAPFARIHGGTLTRLKVEGTILAGIDPYAAAGIATYSSGVSVISHCISSVTIDSREVSFISAGLVCQNYDMYSVLSISDCLFDGSLIGNDTYGSRSGFVGANDNKVIIKNCLFDPSDVEVPASENNFLFCPEEYIMLGLDTDYYRQTAEGFVVQGIDGRDMTAEELAKALGDGWEVKGGRAVPVMDQNDLCFSSVSGVEEEYLSTGSIIHPVPSVKDYMGNELIAGTDYVVSYSSEDDSISGSYSLVIEAPEGSAYHGSKTVYYEVYSAGDKDISGLGTGTILNPTAPGEEGTDFWTGN